MKTLEYDRGKAVEYARKWAFGRNPKYLDFETMGGDCTNYASQCIYAGCGVMNPAKKFGWHYYSAYNRTPSWTGVQYLFNFLISNKSVGPYAKQASEGEIMPGDIIQLGNSVGRFYHSPVVVGRENGEIYVAAHSFDAYLRPLSSYIYSQIRYIHIIGYRNW